MSTNHGKQKVDLTISVSGTPVTLETNVNQPLKSLIERALKEANEIGDPEQWGFFVEDDKKMVSIDGDLKVEEALKRPQPLYLNKKAGAAGWL